VRDRWRDYVHDVRLDCGQKRARVGVWIDFVPKARAQFRCGDHRVRDGNQIGIGALPDRGRMLERHLAPAQQGYAKYLRHSGTNPQL